MKVVTFNVEPELNLFQRQTKRQRAHHRQVPRPRHDDGQVVAGVRVSRQNKTEIIDGAFSTFDDNDICYRKIKIARFENDIENFRIKVQINLIQWGLVNRNSG